MYDTPKDLLDAYRRGPELFTALLQGLRPEQNRVAPGDWSAVEIICHLRDAEERSLERMRRMRDEQNPYLASYDQEALAREHIYARADLSEALAAFTRLRQAHVTELAALSPEQWSRTGQHEELGQIDILSHTIHKISHDVVHAAQLARLGGSHAV